MRVKTIIILICVLSLGVLFVFSCGNGSGKWIAKIKKDEISFGMFNSLYYAQLKQMYNDPTDADVDKRAANPDEVAKNPILDKREFLEQVIRQRLIYNKAVEEGIFKEKEVEALVQMAKEAIVVGYYVNKKYKDQVTITGQEIEKVYYDQRARFKNVPVDQAEQYIRQQLMQQKLQLKLRDLVETLKEEGGIKRNLELIGKKDDSVNKADSLKSEKKEEKINKTEKPAVKEEPKK